MTHGDQLYARSLWKAADFTTQGIPLFTGAVTGRCKKGQHQHHNNLSCFHTIDSFIGLLFFYILIHTAIAGILHGPLRKRHRPEMRGG